MNVKIRLCIVRNRTEGIEPISMNTSLNNDLALYRDDVDDLRVLEGFSAIFKFFLRIEAPS